VPDIRERPPSTLKMSTASPLGGADGDPGAPIINVKTCRQWAPREAVTKIHERTPSMLKNIDDGPLGDGVGDLGAPIINAENVDGGPPLRC
jgi:hypothetical protein